MIKNLKLSTFMCGCFAVFSSVFFVQSLSYSYWNKQFAPGAGFIPRWVSGILIILSVIAFIQSLKEDGLRLSEALPKGKYKFNTLMCWSILLLFAFFAEKLGLVLTGTAMLTILFKMGFKWPKAIVLGLGVSLVCFFVFKILLQVDVPVNQFGF
ncbi:MAG: tripartite tricarboxylate transporter family receptor [Clostridiales bacterium]|jgi:hypothetical protein|nr:tripartite tricarboxylate transporter family receptor [Clostridiales bacterium]